MPCHIESSVWFKWCFCWTPDFVYVFHLHCSDLTHLNLYQCHTQQEIARRNQEKKYKYESDTCLKSIKVKVTAAFQHLVKITCWVNSLEWNSLFFSNWNVGKKICSKIEFHVSYLKWYKFRVFLEWERFRLFAWYIERMKLEKRFIIFQFFTLTWNICYIKGWWLAGCEYLLLLL